ncbi:LANA-like protein [Cricetid gammaherpesvirus 2]|uniref:LANA-like protein n=1 Tax=Cricetid gammaherpesvirus 2 TaxID=1605972 RepID=E9M5Q6_9GAMA|nr:LANA-like protein [Cricetid gammaherpesvirus 2]ADW24414.1 LANA-like protein [Cricetid gammaherpesvirus 2]ADW24496.1 LANA-like protein [Cricetid gammaherpesvirus 2]
MFKSPKSTRRHGERHTRSSCNQRCNKQKASKKRAGPMKKTVDGESSSSGIANAPPQKPHPESSLHTEELPEEPSPASPPEAPSSPETGQTSQEPHSDMDTPIDTPTPADSPSPADSPTPMETTSPPQPTTSMEPTNTQSTRPLPPNTQPDKVNRPKTPKLSTSRYQQPIDVNKALPKKYRAMRRFLEREIGEPMKPDATPPVTFKGCVFIQNVSPFSLNRTAKALQSPAITTCKPCAMPKPMGATARSTRYFAMCYCENKAIARKIKRALDKHSAIFETKTTTMILKSKKPFPV